MSKLKGRSMRILMIAAATVLTAAACSPDEPVTAEPAAAAPASGASSAAAADPAGAEAFLRQQPLAKYASLAANEAAGETEAAQSDADAAKDTQATFTPQLAQLVNRAAATEGGLDSDPICRCNDDSAMVIRSVQSAPQADGRMLSTVSFDSRDADGRNYPVVIVYTLEQTPAGWRIADVADRSAGREGDPGLLRRLSQP